MYDIVSGNKKVTQAYILFIIIDSGIEILEIGKLEVGVWGAAPFGRRRTVLMTSHRILA